MKLNYKEILYYIINRVPRIIIGKFITRNLVKVHWGRGLKNFGDCLQPDTLRHYGLLPVYVPTMAKSDIIMAGSILDMVPDNYSGYVIGTGGGAKDLVFQNAKVKVVRGHLTHKRLPPHLYKQCKLGDCGLLCRLVYPAKVNKKYKLGIIPHFIDANNPAPTMLQKKYPNDITVISPLGNPRKIIHKIKECEAIISSSLHGLIIADAFGIPSRRWVDRNTQPINHPQIKYDLKFDDYYSSIDFSEDPISLNGDELLQTLITSTTLKSQKKINKLIFDLNQEMLTFRNAIIKKYRKKLQ